MKANRGRISRAKCKQIPEQEVLLQTRFCSIPAERGVMGGDVGLVLLVRINQIKPGPSWPGVLCANPLPPMDHHKPHFVAFPGDVSRPHGLNSTSCQGAAALAPVQAQGVRLRKQLEPQPATCDPTTASPGARHPPTPPAHHCRGITSHPLHVHRDEQRSGSFPQLLTLGKAPGRTGPAPFPELSPENAAAEFPAKPPLPHPNAPQLLPAPDNPDEFSEIVHMKQETSLKIGRAHD